MPRLSVKSLYALSRKRCRYSRHAFFFHRSFVYLFLISSCSLWIKDIITSCSCLVLRSSSSLRLLMASHSALASDSWVRKESIAPKSSSGDVLGSSPKVCAQDSRRDFMSCRWNIETRMRELFWLTDNTEYYKKFPYHKKIKTPDSLLIAKSNHRIISFLTIITRPQIHKHYGLKHKTSLFLVGV